MGTQESEEFNHRIKPHKTIADATPAQVRASCGNTASSKPTANPTDIALEPDSKSYSVPEKRHREQRSRQSKASRSGASPHVAVAVPDGDFEPRTRLLWSIVGQASSVDWKNRAPAVHSPQSATESNPANLDFPDKAPSHSHLEKLRLQPSGLPPIVEATRAHNKSEVAPEADQGVEAVRAYDRSEAAQKADQGVIEMREPRDDGGSHALSGGNHHRYDWADLQPELLSSIGRTFRSAGPLQQMASTCRFEQMPSICMIVFSQQDFRPYPSINRQV